MERRFARPLAALSRRHEISEISGSHLSSLFFMAAPKEFVVQVACGGPTSAGAVREGHARTPWEARTAARRSSFASVGAVKTTEDVFPPIPAQSVINTSLNELTTGASYDHVRLHGL